MTDVDDAQFVVNGDIRQAVRALANAAATSELEPESGAEHQLWFIVRALCHEHAIDLPGVVERARNVARMRKERLRL